MEIWKEIVGSKCYSISNCGRIRREEYKIWSVRNQGWSTIKQKILKPNNNNTKKYWRITIDYLDKSVNESIHRLVAKAFIPNPNNLPQVNHIDGNKNNNNISNLEWCTNEYNRRHAWETGLMNPFLKSIEGEKSHLNKYPEATIRRIPKLIEGGYSYNKIGKMLGIPPTLITEIKSGRAWKHLNLTIPDSKVYRRKI